MILPKPSAEYLGVELKIIIAEEWENMVPKLLNGGRSNYCGQFYRHPETEGAGLVFKCLHEDSAADYCQSG